MHRRPTHRLTTTLCMVLSLLFSQLALAGYVCPAPADADAMVAMSDMAASAEPCAGMDRTQPVLCHQHAEAAALSFEAARLPVATAPMVVQVIVLPMVQQAVDAVAVPSVAAPEARPPPDPVFLATRRLRV